MKNLIKTTLLTVAAVPFLMAAPHAAKKAQNTTTPAATQNQTATAKPKAVKKVKKSKKSTSTQSNMAAPAVQK